MKRKVVIAGGGIIGLFCAYYLNKDGYEVEIIDKGSNMVPASSGNCGLITPSHIPPLNQFSTIYQGLKWLNKKDAPLKIKPQLSSSFLLWMVQFTWYANIFSFNKNSQKRHEYLDLSWRLYHELFNEEGFDAGFNTTDGILYVCKSEKALKGVEEEAHLLSDNYGLNPEYLNYEALRKLEPNLNRKIIGGYWYNMDGWLNPATLITNLKDHLIAHGVSFRKDVITNINSNKTIIKGFSSEREEYKGDYYLVATGALAPQLLKNINISLPIIPGKGYNLTTQSSIVHQPMRPIHMVERKVVATPWKNGFRLGSTMELSGYDISLNKIRLDALKRASQEYLNIDVYNNVEWEPWAGWRPMKSNGVPVVEKNKKYTNLVIAAGHSMLGLSMAPATGYMVSKII
ncbi:MAG TPA: NAD(P)/FAD-dependent oxidoreductase [Cyclobacteriaceae bacterium]